jgi:small conductance mechanosensitive channel
MRARMRVERRDSSRRQRLRAIRLLPSAFCLNSSLIPHPSSLLLQPAPQSIREVFERLHARLLNAVPGIVTGAMVFAVFLLAAWVGRRVIEYAAPRVKADTGVVLLLSRVYYYSIIIFGIITALSAAGLNVSALVAGLGLTGFVLGFALKDVLSNLVSGIMLLIYHPFRIGDQIRMGEHEGTIQTIRMRDTVVEAYDGRSIVIPNTKLITEVVVTNTSAKLVRESVAVGIAPDADVKEARELILQVMGKIPAVAGRAERPVRVKQVDQNYTQLEASFWFDPFHVNRVEIKREIIEAIRQAFDRVGLKWVALPESETLPKAKAAARAASEGEEIPKSEEVETV